MTTLKEKISISFKKHHFYYKILLPFSLLSVILVCIMASINWYWIENENNQKITESNQQFLTKAANVNDLYLYTTFTSVIHQYFLDGYATSKLNRFITYGDKLKASEFLNIYQTLHLISVQNDTLQRIALYHKNSDLYLDNQKGLCYNASFNTSKDFIFLETCLSLISEQDKQLIFYTSNPSDIDRNTLVILHSLPLYSNFPNEDGFIAMEIDMTLLWDSLKIFSLSEDTAFMILDPSGKLLFEHSPADGFYQSISKDTDSSVLPSFFTYEGTQYRLDHVKSDVSELQYISCVPINILNAETKSRHQIMLMIFVLCLLLSLGSVQRISSHAYQPIANLRKRLDHNHSSENIKDDLSLIEDTFSFLENQVDDMRNTLQQNNKVFLYKIFMDILSKKDLSDKQLLHKLNLYGVTVEDSDFVLFLAEFDQQIFYSLPLEQREYLVTKVGTLIETFLQETVIQAAVTHPENRFAVLLALHPGHYEALVEKLELLPDYIEDTLHIQVNLAYSTPVKELSKISEIHSVISEYLKYCFILGYGNLFTDKLIQKLDSSPFRLTLQDYQQIERIIRTGNPDEFSSLMESYENIVTSGECSYQEANNILIQIYGIAFHISKEGHIFDDSSKKEQLLYDFKHAVNFHHSMECICLIVQMYYESLHDEALNADLKFIQQVTSYIDEHCREELSLPNVAQIFRVSTGHLSRLFKSVTHSNFSVYVMNKKLDAAAEMLKKEPDKEISAIAAELGYYTPAYFSKLFKEKFGVTPSQYRKP